MAKDLVLLTGATGMIGFRTLVQLLEAGYSVRAAVRNQAGFDRIAAFNSVAKYRSQLTSFIVPEITTPGAYDEAVKGVKYIIHGASPLPNTDNPDHFESEIVQPAIRGTVGILESAIKTSGIEKIVITASIASIASMPHSFGPGVINEQTRTAITDRPFPHAFQAYAASKALAHQATEQFIQDNKPSFNIINIMPVFVWGKDETVSEASKLVKGSSSLILGPVLGGEPNPLLSFHTVHIDDVATVQVLALNPDITGNQDFLLSAPDSNSVDLQDEFDFVKKQYPKEYANGVFKFDTVSRPQAQKMAVDSSKASKAFNITFKGYETQIKDTIDQYLDLSAKL